MAGPEDAAPGDAGAARRAGRWAAGLTPARLRDRARATAAVLRDEYRAGRRGETGPVTPLWAGPREQLDAVVTLLRRAREAPAAGAGRPAVGLAEAELAEVELAEARAVAEAVGEVDWDAVRASLAAGGPTAQQPASTGVAPDPARAVRAMAEQVDWARVQPLAAGLARALIAAVAAGHLPVGGRAGGVVARAIVDQAGFGGLVAQQLQRAGVAVPVVPVPDLRQDEPGPGATRRASGPVIDVTGRDDG